MGVLSTGGVGHGSRLRQRDDLPAERGRGAARAELRARDARCHGGMCSPSGATRGRCWGARRRTCRCSSPVNDGAVGDVESAAALMRSAFRKGAGQAPRARERPAGGVACAGTDARVELAALEQAVRSAGRAPAGAAARAGGRGAGRGACPIDDARGCHGDRNRRHPPRRSACSTHERRGRGAHRAHRQSRQSTRPSSATSAAKRG